MEIAMRPIIILVFATLALAACQSSLTPAMMSDVERLEDKVDSIPEAQRDAYVKAKAEGRELEERVEKALDAGLEMAQASRATDFADWDTWLLLLLGGGAAGTGGATALSRKRRGLSILTGQPKAPAPPA